MVDVLVAADALVRLFGGGRTWLGRRVPVVRAVDGVSFWVRHGETLGVVGESGSGKSTLARMLVGLLAPSAGHLSVAGRPVRGLAGVEAVRFHRAVQMVFQDPVSSLNPRKTVRQILEGPVQVLLGAGRAERRDRVARILDLVGLRPEFLERYPHEFSGGQAQRIGLARALVVEPELLVLDEPVSALDVSIQAQVLTLLRDLQTRLGLTYVFISHDLAVIEALCDRVLVMRDGRVVETGPCRTVFRAPQHAYTRSLMAAVPVVRQAIRVCTP